MDKWYHKTLSDKFLKEKMGNCLADITSGVGIIAVLPFMFRDKLNELGGPYVENMD